jgi:hypothetical protein
MRPKSRRRIARRLGTFCRPNATNASNEDSNDARAMPGEFQITFAPDAASGADGLAADVLVMDSIQPPNGARWRQ